MLIDDIFAWGSPGLTTPVGSEEAIELIRLRLIDQQYFHSCFDYVGQFDYLVKESANLDIPIRLIAKVYLDFPVFSSARRAPVLRQVENIHRFFDGRLSDLTLQLSSVPYGFYDSHENAMTFLGKAFRDFGVTKVFIETFPEGENDSRRLLELLLGARMQLGLEDKIVLGFTSYEGIEVRGFSSELLSYIADNKLYYMPMRVLSFGSGNQGLQALALSKEKVLEDSKYKYFFRAITGTTKILHYQENRNTEFSDLGQLRSRSFIKEYSDSPRINAVNPYGIIYHRCYDFDRLAKESKHIILNVLSLLKNRKSLLLVFRQGLC
jgi:hypothetical protein